MATSSTRSTRPATSGSWLTSTPVRRRRPSASCTTRARRTRSARSTTALPPWTGWSRSRSAASRSRPPRRRAFWKDHRIQIIDTPGHVDFTVEVERSLRVLDGAVAVFCAVGGVEPQSETVWRQADTYGVPRIAYINKMDRSGADFYNVVADDEGPPRRARRCRSSSRSAPRTSSSASSTSSRCTPIFFNEDDKGINPTVGEIPAELRDEAEMYRHELVEAAAEHDDELMMKFLEDEEITRRRDQGRAAQGAASPTRSRRSSAAPRSRTRASSRCSTRSSTSCRRRSTSPAIKGIDLKTDEEVERPADAKAPFAALAFKVMTDPFVGKLTYFRVYSGTLNSGSYVLNSTKGHKERIGRLLQMHANHREDVDVVSAGDIVAAVGLKNTTTGDTLCAEDAPVLLESMVFPDPVIDIAIEPKTKAEQDKLGSGARQARRGGPDVPGPHRHGDRPDDHRRHGRAAPRGHRRPPAARVQGRGQRRQAAGRVPRDRRQARSTTST